jgi:hypothetical protein
MEGWMDEWKNGWVGGWIDDGWMDGQMDGLMDRWVGEWMDRNGVKNSGPWIVLGTHLLWWFLQPYVRILGLIPSSFGTSEMLGSPRSSRPAFLALTLETQYTGWLYIQKRS